jgi:soluble lytic murein transglycosylase-like protein
VIFLGLSERIIMNKREILKYTIFILIVMALIINTAMTCLLTVWINEDRKSLKNLQNDIQEIKNKLETEIKLREELFPKLKKSAQLLRKYNPRLDYVTALKYACKIYECSDEDVSFNILTALIVVESSANHIAVSRRGATGLTQVMPGIWRFDRNTLIDPYKNIEIGSSILKYYINRHGLDGGLSAYNSGRKNGSIRYARKVLRIANQYF